MTTVAADLSIVSYKLILLHRECMKASCNAPGIVSSATAIAFKFTSLTFFLKTNDCKFYPFIWLVKEQTQDIKTFSIWRGLTNVDPRKQRMETLSEKLSGA